MKELIKKYILAELKEEDKSEAQKETEVRSDKYTEFFKKPLTNLKTDQKYKLAIAYKMAAGFFINSDKLDSTTIKDSFRTRLNEKKNIKEKAFFICATGVKIIAKTALSSVQFIVRNSIKQPAMLLFRIGAGANNLRKYRAAKRKGDDTIAAAELKNIKYQAKEARNALIGTAVTAAIIISTIGSAGITIPFFGAATTAIVTTSSAIDTAAMAKDAAQGTFKQIKGRRGETNPDIYIKKGIELLPMRTALKSSDKGPASRDSLPYQALEIKGHKR